MTTRHKDKTGPRPPRHDATLYYIGTKKNPVYCVRLHQRTAAAIFALLAFRDEDAADLVDAGVRAIWAIFQKHGGKPLHRTAPKKTRRRGHDDPTSVGTILNDSTSKVRAQETDS